LNQTGHPQGRPDVSAGVVDKHQKLRIPSL